MEICRDCESRTANCESGVSVSDRARSDRELIDTSSRRCAGPQIRNPRSAIRNPQSGFTLAGLLVIVSVIAVITAFLVPKMWSEIMWRERDLQTIFVMKQYAQAISEFQRITGALPTNLEQLENQKLPRALRQTYVNPLSGELDWILVPEGTATPALQQQPGQGGPTQPGAQGNQPPGTGRPPQGQGPGQPTNQFGQPGTGDPRNFSGPFIGVRPPQTGRSFVELNEQQQYENWMYTINELTIERAARGAGAPPGQQQPGGPQN